MSLNRMIENSFLSRVPDLMAKDTSLTVEDAMLKAFDIEEKFCIRMQQAAERRGYVYDKTAGEAISILANRVYTRLRAQ